MIRARAAGIEFEAPSATGRTRHTGFAGLRTDVQRESYTQLSWVASLLLLLFVVNELLDLVFPPARGSSVADAWATPLLVVISVAVAWVCRTGRLRSQWFPTVAIGFEVVAGLTLSTQVLNWQNLVGESGWALGGTPAVGLWVVFFAAVVALPPATHLLGATLTVLTLPTWFFISLRAYDVAPGTEPADTLLVFGQLMAPCVIGVVIAYLTARRVYTLSSDLSETRRMGSYQLLEKLGQGGMGEVWKARHHMLARPAAVKLIRSEVASPGGAKLDTQLKRFEQEVQATANLRSQHTIEVYDYGVSDDESFYYVMELLDGLDLQQLVKQDGPQPSERVVHILRQACHSLGEAHDRGLVHRDIKPANIFVCRYGREVDLVKVLDFGMVKDTGSGQTLETVQLGDIQATSAQLTQAGIFAGTPAYAAPEMITGDSEVDARSDIYALGCVAFWMLTGRLVFPASDPMRMLVQHASAVPDPPSTHAPEVPPELDDIVLTCLAKEPAKRFRSVDELSAKLAAVPVGQPWTRSRAEQWWRTHVPRQSSGELGD